MPFAAGRQWRNEASKRRWESGVHPSLSITGKNIRTRSPEHNLQLQVRKDYESGPLNQDAFFKPEEEKRDCFLISDLASCTWVIISYISPEAQRTELAVA